MVISIDIDRKSIINESVMNFWNRLWHRINFSRDCKFVLKIVEKYFEFFSERFEEELYNLFILVIQTLGFSNIWILFQNHRRLIFVVVLANWQI